MVVRVTKDIADRNCRAVGEKREHQLVDSSRAFATRGGNWEALEAGVVSPLPVATL